MVSLPTASNKTTFDATNLVNVSNPVTSAVLFIPLKTCASGVKIFVCNTKITAVDAA